MSEHTSDAAPPSSTCTRGNGLFVSWTKKSDCSRLDARYAGILSICVSVMSTGLNTCSGIGAFRASATLVFHSRPGHVALAERLCWHLLSNYQLTHKPRSPWLPAPVVQLILSQNQISWTRGPRRPARQ